MPGIAKSGYTGLLSKWLPDPALLLPSARTGWTGLRNGVRSVMTYEPLRNALMCNLAKNFWIGATSFPGQASTRAPKRQ